MKLKEQEKIEITPEFLEQNRKDTIELLKALDEAEKKARESELVIGSSLKEK